MRKLLTACALSALILGLVGCGSTPKQEADTTNSKDIDKVVVVDWTDRTLGEESVPSWLKNVRRGNADAFKQQFGTDKNRVVKVSQATGKTEAEAQALSRAGFAYSQAAELSQKVIGRVGQGINDGGQLEALFMAASETKADMSGLREETGFVQKVRITNAETGDVTEKYIYYTVFSMDKENWDNLCKKYLMDVMGDASLTTETKKKIGALFSEMKEDADKKEAKKQAEEEALYQAQMKRLEAERAKAIQGTAEAGLKAKQMDAEEAKIKAATDEAAELESYLS